MFNFLKRVLRTSGRIRIDFPWLTPAYPSVPTGIVRFWCACSLGWTDNISRNADKDLRIYRCPCSRRGRSNGLESITGVLVVSSINILRRGNHVCVGQIGTTMIAFCTLSLQIFCRQATTNQCKLRRRWQFHCCTRASIPIDLGSSFQHLHLCICVQGKQVYCNYTDWTFGSELERVMGPVYNCWNRWNVCSHGLLLMDTPTPEFHSKLLKVSSSHLVDVRVGYLTVHHQYNINSFSATKLWRARKAPWSSSQLMWSLASANWYDFSGHWLTIALLSSCM